MSILITGAAGSLGTALVERLSAGGLLLVATDIDTLDVTEPDEASWWIERWRPEVIFHLAAAKHAPEGELDPGHVARVNLDGTRNVIEAAEEAGVRVILSSTCKAANPETAYGASKLIAERLVLNAGGTVIRLYNVPESSGNVFRLWEELPDDAPIPWTSCWRYFTPLSVAVELAVAALKLPPGRYAPIPGPPRYMRDVARELYPTRTLVHVPRRRGDRASEPLKASSERLTVFGAGIARVRCRHDAPGLVLA